MITHLHLKNGSSASQPPLVVETPPSITIFVGPNNSGKSQALREIHSFCTSGQVNTASRILSKIVFKDTDQNSAMRIISDAQVLPNHGEIVPPGHSIVKFGAQRLQIHSGNLLAGLVAPNTHPGWFAGSYLQHLILNLDGLSRINLVGNQSRGNLQHPSSPFARLLTNDIKRNALREVIYDSLGFYFALDAQSGNELHIKFGDTPPPDERSFNDEAIEYMRSARGIDAVSDGVKAYTGILLQLYAGDPKIIIIDEPEAFLHPALAQRLGKEIANAAANEGKHVFVSTHSSQFVMGAILSGAKVNIIRLTYETGIGTARLLPSSELTKLMQDPLLRSVGVLSGLFYNYVVVGEANADRAFYHEINERLLAAGDPRGTPHTLFLNADNKQTIPRIIDPLRKLGIPAAAIVDVDILKDGGEDWTRHLKACNIPTTEHQPYGTKRGRILDSLVSQNADFKSQGGIDLLSGQDREAAENLFDELARYGLFVVRPGEVETWLTNLSVPRAKHTWLRKIFEQMGSDTSSSSYVRPTSGDVWDFMGSVHSWLVDPSRRGIPT